MFLQRTSVLLTGLLAGCDAVFLVPVNRTYKTFSEVEYARAHRIMVRVAGPTAPLLAGPLLLVKMLLLLKMRRRDSGRTTFVRTLVSLLCLLLNAAITFAVNLPINRRFLQAPEQSPPDDWDTLRDRWTAAHNVRTAIQLLGFATLLAGWIRPPLNDSGRASNR